MLISLMRKIRVLAVGAALSGVIILFTLAMMIIMERATGLSRRLRS